MKVRLLCVVGIVVFCAGCASTDAVVNSAGAERNDRPEVAGGGDKTEQRRDRNRTQRPVDPRDGGFEIALGEWALSPEAPAIRPGRVTFVIHNRGTMAHGFEIALEGESSGHGSGDRFKAEGPLMRPGTTTRITLDLGPGIYEIECLVDGHDNMGMEAVLEVSADAPLVRRASGSNDRPAGVSIDDFAFSPDSIEVKRGTELTWHNQDVAPHTVTSTADAFDSDTLDQGSSFSFRFSEPGTFDYRCLIHPDMKGSVTVR